MPSPGESDPVARNARAIDEFRRNDGQIGGEFRGIAVLLLHTTDRDSRSPRVHPLTYREHPDGWVVVASAAGADSHPSWYRNLTVHPAATVEVGRDVVAVVAHIPRGEERRQLWTDQKLLVPRLADYERLTRRVIPVIVLRRR